MAVAVNKTAKLVEGMTSFIYCPNYSTNCVIHKLNFRRGFST